MTKHKTLMQRVDIVELYQQKVAIREIASRMGVSKNTVLRWVQRYKESGNVHRKVYTCNRDPKANSVSSKKNCDVDLLNDIDVVNEVDLPKGVDVPHEIDVANDINLFNDIDQSNHIDLARPNDNPYLSSETTVIIEDEIIMPSLKWNRIRTYSRMPRPFIEPSYESNSDSVTTLKQEPAPSLLEDESEHNISKEVESEHIGIDDESELDKETESELCCDEDSYESELSSDENMNNDVLRKEPDWPNMNILQKLTSIENNVDILNRQVSRTKTQYDIFGLEVSYLLNNLPNKHAAKLKSKLDNIITAFKVTQKSKMSQKNPSDSNLQNTNTYLKRIVKKRKVCSRDDYIKSIELKLTQSTQKSSESNSQNEVVSVGSEQNVVVKKLKVCSRDDYIKSTKLHQKTTHPTQSTQKSSESNPLKEILAVDNDQNTEVKKLNVKTKIPPQVRDYMMLQQIANVSEAKSKPITNNIIKHQFPTNSKLQIENRNRTISNQFQLGNAPKRK